MKRKLIATTVVTLGALAASCVYIPIASLTQENDTPTPAVVEDVIVLWIGGTGEDDRCVSDPWQSIAGDWYCEVPVSLYPTTPTLPTPPRIEYPTTP